MVRRTASSARQAGVTLIEILVSILLIAFGILTMATVQSNMMKFQKGNEYRAIATLMASDLADRMRANKGGAELGGYAWATTGYADGVVDSDEAGGTPPACGTVVSAKITPGCDPAQMAAKDLVEWKKQLRYSLPGASAHITAFDASTQALDLWVAWVDPDNTDASGQDMSSRTADCPAAWRTSTVNYRCISLRVAL